MHTHGSVGRVSDYHAGGGGFEPWPEHHSVLKYLRRKCCLYNYICKWFKFQVFSDKEPKP